MSSDILTSTKLFDLNPLPARLASNSEDCSSLASSIDIQLEEKDFYAYDGVLYKLESTIDSNDSG